MNILEVIPLVNLPPQIPQLLSYFCNEPLPRGALIEIQMNNRKISAIVASSSSVEERKISLKKSGFQLKKISSVISRDPVIGDIQFKLGLWLARNYFSPLGMSFKAILPPFFNNSKKPFYYPDINNKNTFEPEFLISNASNTINSIIPRIRKVLGEKDQVLIIAPEKSIAEYFYNSLSSIFSSALIHSGISETKAYEDWQKISSGKTEVIIGTRQALFAPFFRLGLIIMEDPSNEAYKSDMSPRYNTRDLAFKIAEVYSAKLLFVSSTPDIVSYYLAKEGRLNLIPEKDIKKVDIESENMINEIRSGNLSIFSRKLRKEIESFAKENKKILIFSTRKGYSSSLMCENCKFYFNCPQCSVPFRVYRFPAETLACHKCSGIQKIPDHCPSCNSYKLKAAGFYGTEKIKEELEYILKLSNIKKSIFIFDTATVKTAKQEADLIKNINKSDSFICISTQSVFGRRYELNFDLIGISNLDSLTTMPDFRVEEDLFIQFNKLLDFRPEKVIIQTFDPAGKMSDFLTNVKFDKFYDKELAIRDLFMYPPFARVIKFSFLSPDKSRANREARILNDKLKTVITQRRLDEKVKILGPSPAFIEKQKGSYVFNIILKVKNGFNIEEIVKFVPSFWYIDVDPKSIL